MKKNQNQLLLRSRVYYNRGLFAIKRWTMYTGMDNLYGYFINQLNSYALWIVLL